VVLGDVIDMVNRLDRSSCSKAIHLNAQTVATQRSLRVKTHAKRLGHLRDF
jgi:hypothetical protein